MAFEAKHKPDFKVKYKTSKQCGTHSHSFHFIPSPQTDTEHTEVTLLWAPALSSWSVVDLWSGVVDAPQFYTFHLSVDLM